MVSLGTFLVSYEGNTLKYFEKDDFSVISITKKEKDKLVKLFPPNKPPYYRFPRTMKQDSKRHHYFCTEAEELVRVIADSNAQAAELTKKFDQMRALREARMRATEGGN